MQFKDIPGLDSLKKRLTGNAASGRIAHAQMFLGPQGSANLALALAYAQFLCCENRQDNDSCGECNACNKYKKLIHPDLHFSYPTVGSNVLSSDFIAGWREILSVNPYFNEFEWMQKLDAENKQGNITVAECRDIIKKLSMRAFEGKYKVLIMWMPEYLGKEGNTLLKLIEEPPENTLFILVASNQEDILQTILSRTQLIKVRRFTDEEVEAHLAHALNIPREQASGIAFMSEGNMNTAINLLKDADTAYFNTFRSWLLYCYGAKLEEMLKWTDENSRLGRENLKHLLEYGLKLLRECVLLKSGADDILRVKGEEKEFVVKFAKIVQISDLQKMTDELSNHVYHIERNANPKISLFSLSLRFKNILTSSGLNSRRVIPGSG